MENVYKGFNIELPITFGNGICGIGWAMEYLLQHGFIEGDSAEILEEIDIKVMERDPLRITDWSLRSGLRGILNYVVCRLKSVQRENQTCFFDKRYLTDLQQAVGNMFCEVEPIEGQAIALEYMDFMRTGIWEVKSPEIADLLTLHMLVDEDVSALKLGVDGCIGYAIKIVNLLNNTKI